jgi:hypothetical protein
MFMPMSCVEIGVVDLRFTSANRWRQAAASRFSAIACKAFLRSIEALRSPDATVASTGLAHYASELFLGGYDEGHLIPIDVITFRRAASAAEAAVA